MTAKTVFDTAAGDIFELNADPGAATFTPTEGDTVACNIDIRHDVQLSGEDSQVWSEGTVLQYLISEIGREVYLEETFTVGVVVWTVKEILANDGRFSTVTVK